jgi:hypothetical protein
VLGTGEVVEYVPDLGGGEDHGEVLGPLRRWELTDIAQFML